jgi:hypothetical protein
LEDQEFAETQLNTLMKKYKENMQLKDAYYEQRKQDKIENALLEKDAWTKRQAEALATAGGNAPVDSMDIAETVEPPASNSTA